MRQLGEEIGHLGNRQFRQDQAGLFLAQKSHELALGARLRLDEHFGRLARLQGREHRLLFIAEEDLEASAKSSPGSSSAHSRVTERVTTSLLWSSTESGCT